MIKQLLKWRKHCLSRYLYRNTMEFLCCSLIQWQRVKPLSKAGELHFFPDTISCSFWKYHDTPAVYVTVKQL